VVAAQVLLVPHDFVDRRQYLHARQTLVRLLELGCVPIINENDAIANDEIRYGDNDRIAALVAHNLAADLLVLLTDTAGLYTSDPRTDPAAALIARVAADDPLLSVSAGESGSNRGSGGMASKLAAARTASFSGVRAVIAASARPDVLVEAANDLDVGTTFMPNDRKLSARKLWIGFASLVEGSVTVDDGARRALLERGTSLLPAGVVDVRGAFDEESIVELRGTDGTVIARGMVLCDADTLRAIKGRRTADLPAEMAHEVVHRDDLVLLS
jgi:glutamate 5-kinase